MLVVIVLGLACTAVAFMLYYSLIAQVGEERVAFGNYLMPIFTPLYGVILLGGADHDRGGRRVGPDRRGSGDHASVPDSRNGTVTRNGHPTHLRAVGDPDRLPRGVPRLHEAVAYGLPAPPSDEELSELGVQVGHRTA